MPQAARALPALDLEAILQASDQLQSLTAKLPADAVEAFAREVVNRLTVNLQLMDQHVEPISSALIERLCQALVSNDSRAGAIMISKIRADGTSVADVYVLYLAAAARRLGEKWVTQDLSFAEVTIGTSRILAIMRSLRGAFGASRPFNGRSVVFASVPDEQHTIGITMASDMFRREGWEIELIVGETHDEILKKVSASEALVVGLTAHGKRSLAGLVRLIAAIRIVKPAAYILVSGHIVEEAKDIMELTGADGIAGDISTAFAEVRRIYDLAHS